MRVLVLGAEGMLGSAVMRELTQASGTTRRRDGPMGPRILPGVDITVLDDLKRIFYVAEPDVVVNCAGIVKSECKSNRVLRVDAVNGIAPHTIAVMARAANCRVIQISTDCVFTGLNGNYTEDDSPDATDVYGGSKRMGEIVNLDHCVTLRTSFIGRDPVHRRGLLEWLILHATDTLVPAYSQAMWSGLSTPELARVIRNVVDNESLSGLYHVAGPAISKAQLLETLIRAYDLPCRAQLENEPQIDRTLDGSKFVKATDYVSPTWLAMTEELARS